MSQGLAGTHGGTDLMWYNGQVAALRGSSQGACEDRVEEYEIAMGADVLFTYMDDVSCADAVSDEDPFYVVECVKHEDECTQDEPVNGTGGAPGVDETAADGGGAFVYGLSDYDDVIDVTGSHADIDIDFVKEVLGDLSVFEDDNIGVTLELSDKSNLGFRFKHLGSESFPVALGFEQDDFVVSLNGIAMDSVADVTLAFESLSQEYDFTVTIDRGMTTITKTFKFVDMQRYP